MTQTLLPFRLGLVSILVAGALEGHPIRASAQLTQRNQLQTRAVTTQIERATEVDSAYRQFALHEFDHPVDPGAQHASALRAALSYVSTRSGSTLQSSERGSRSKHVLVGALAGAAIGAVAAVAFPAKCRTGTSDVPCALGRPIEVAFDMSLGAVAGGVIAALLPTGH